MTAGVRDTKMAAFGVQLVLLLVAGSNAQIYNNNPNTYCSTRNNGDGICTSSSNPCPSGYEVDPEANSISSYYECFAFYQKCCRRATVTVAPTTMTPAATTATAAPTTTTAPTATLQEADCGLGLPLRRILQGQNTAKCQYPQAVSIRRRRVLDGSSVGLDLSNTGHICGGTFLDNRWVLTHPTCCYLGFQPSTAPNNLLVVGADYNIQAAESDPRTPGSNIEQLHRVKACHVHPDFNANNGNIQLQDSYLTNSNGFALLELADPVDHYCASAACLPSAPALNFASGNCDTLTNCVMLGWGFTQEGFTGDDGLLKQGRVRVFRGESCDLIKQVVSGSATNIIWSTSQVPVRSTCMQPEQTITDACPGDQGGPVMCYDGNRWSVQGVLPVNLCQNLTSQPYVQDVSQGESWIRQTIQNNPA